MMAWLTQSLNEHSLLLVFISAIIGGIVTSLGKLVFEVLIPQSVKDRKEVQRILQRYQIPLMRSTDELTGRIANFLQKENFKWYLESDYYKISTLYVFCCYFGWKELLLSRLRHLKFENTRKNRRFNQIINHVEKTLNNRKYFNSNLYDIHSELPKYICKALGEIIITSSDSKNDGIMTFISFKNRLNSDETFSEWVTYLDDFLRLAASETCTIARDRMNLIMLALIGLSNFLDPKHEITKKYSTTDTINILNSIEHENAKILIRQDITNKKVPVRLEGYWMRIKRQLSGIFHAGKPDSIGQESSSIITKQ